MNSHTYTRLEMKRGCSMIAFPACSFVWPFQYIYKKYSIITVAILAPIFTYIINELVINFTDYKIGVELIILNGLLTFIGLWLVSSNRQKETIIHS